MPALAPQEERQISTRRASTRGARSVSPRAHIAERESDYEKARVLAPPEAPQEKRVPREEIVANARRRRAHRDLRVSLTVGCFAVLIFAQAIAGLMLNGMALTASHRAAKLGDATSGEIGRVNDEIALTQKQIAALGSPAQIKRWADEKRWPMASPQSFDDIRNTTPPPETNDDLAEKDNGTKR